MKERENKGRGAGQNNVQSKGLLTIPLAMFFFFFPENIHKIFIQTNGIRIYVLQLAFFFT